MSSSLLPQNHKVYFGILLAVIALGGGLLYRARLGRAVGGSEPMLSDELVRQIEETGYIEVDEPLDIEEIQEEEARFWEEQWDEPDEW